MSHIINIKDIYIKPEDNNSTDNKSINSNKDVILFYLSDGSGDRTKYLYDFKLLDLIKKLLDESADELNAKTIV